MCYNDVVMLIIMSSVCHCLYYSYNRWKLLLILASIQNRNVIMAIYYIRAVYQYITSKIYLETCMSLFSRLDTSTCCSNLNKLLH